MNQIKIGKQNQNIHIQFNRLSLEHSNVILNCENLLKH